MMRDGPMSCLNAKVDGIGTAESVPIKRKSLKRKIKCMLGSHETKPYKTERYKYDDFIVVIHEKCIHCDFKDKSYARAFAMTGTEYESYKKLHPKEKD